MPTSSFATFSRRKPCASRFSTLCRWPIITPGFWCGTFPLAAQEAKRGSRSPTQQCTGIRRMQPWILSKRTHAHVIWTHAHVYICTLPITSAERERSFSTLRRLKTDLRATMTSERESKLGLMNIHYGRQIDISATIDLFARKHPRHLLLSDSWVNGKYKSQLYTAFDEVCNMLTNCYSISPGSDIYNPLRNGNYVKRWSYWKFVLKIKETPFLKTQNSKIFRGSMPPDPSKKSAAGARLPIGQVKYIRNPSVQKGWLRPWL